MTLHEAIEKLLEEEGRSMTTAEITDALNENKWFTKKDGSRVALKTRPSSLHKS